MYWFSRRRSIMYRVTSMTYSWARTWFLVFFNITIPNFFCQVFHVVNCVTPSLLLPLILLGHFPLLKSDDLWGSHSSLGNSGTGLSSIKLRASWNLCTIYSFSKMSSLVDWSESMENRGLLAEVGMDLVNNSPFTFTFSFSNAMWLSGHITFLWVQLHPLQLLFDFLFLLLCSVNAI